MTLNNIKRPPAQVRGDQIAIGLFLVISDRDDKPFGFVRANVSPGTADHRGHFLSASDTDVVRGPGMGRKVGGDVLFALADAYLLIAADLRNHLHPTEPGRGRIDKGRRAIEGIRGDTVNLDVRMVVLERFKQA